MSRPSAVRTGGWGDLPADAELRAGRLRSLNLAVRQGSVPIYRESRCQQARGSSLRSAAARPEGIPRDHGHLLGHGRADVARFVLAVSTATKKSTVGEGGPDGLTRGSGLDMGL